MKGEKKINQNLWIDFGEQLGKGGFGCVYKGTLKE